MKKTTLITIGESWTWGESLEVNGHNRLTNVYGYHLAKMLNAEWQNIALCSASNAWIAQQYNHCISQNYNSDQVIIVCTLTEVGREFNNPEEDGHRDYISDLASAESLPDVQNLQSKWIETQFLPTNYTTVFGTNFVGNNYKTLPVLEKSWIDIIGDEINQNPPKNVYTVSSWVFDKLAQAPEFKNFNKVKWLESMLNEIDKANTVIDWLLTSPLNYKIASKHPTPKAHKLWAKYLAQEIKRITKSNT